MTGPAASTVLVVDELLDEVELELELDELELELDELELELLEDEAAVVAEELVEEDDEDDEEDEEEELDDELPALVVPELEVVVPPIVEVGVARVVATEVELMAIVPAQLDMIALNSVCLLASLASVSKARPAYWATRKMEATARMEMRPIISPSSTMF